MLLYASVTKEHGRDFGTRRFHELLRAFDGLVLTPPPKQSLLHRKEHQLSSERRESAIFSLYFKDALNSFLVTSQARVLLKILAQGRILQHVHPVVLWELIESSPPSGKECTNAQRALLKVFHFLLLRLHMVSHWKPPVMLQSKDIAQVREAQLPGTNDILHKLFSDTAFLQTTSKCMIAENITHIPTNLLYLVLEAHPVLAALLCTEVIGRYHKTELTCTIQDASFVFGKETLALGENSTKNHDHVEQIKDDVQRNKVELLLDILSRSLTLLHEKHQLLIESPSIWIAIVDKGDLEGMYNDRLLAVCRPLIFLLAKHYSKSQVEGITRRIGAKHSGKTRLLRRFFIAQQLANTEDFDSSKAIVKIEILQKMSTSKSKTFMHALEWYLQLFQFRPSKAASPLLEHLSSCIRVLCGNRMQSRTLPSLQFKAVRSTLISKSLPTLLAIWGESHRRSLI